MSENTDNTTPITLIEAITQALAYEMRNDDAVVVLGEDVGVNGGVFRATAGLQQQFGDERVLDTPLDETTIAGLTVGMASQGMKPVAEAQFDGFMYPMVDFIVCHAARMRYRTRGRLTCPMVLRVPWGGGIRAPEHHSEANESIFTNVPGLRVVMEHITTRDGIDYVRAGGADIGGTITTHHLVINRNHILAGGIRPHYYCLPVAKREAHRLALLEAAAG